MATKNYILRDEIVEYMVDVLGYSVEGTQGFTRTELWEMLTLEQMNEVLEYSA